MNIALDTNAYGDFMRGDGERVRIIRAARSIAIPIIVLGELRAGFSAGNQESINAANLQRFLTSPRISVVSPDEQTTHHYAQLYLQLRKRVPPFRRTISGSRRSPFSTTWFCARPTAISGTCPKS